MAPSIDGWGWRRSGGALAALALSACVSTDVDRIDSALPCTPGPLSSFATPAVVWMTADLGDAGVRYCSAVAIAPLLVVTSYSCVAYPADADYSVRLDPGNDTVFPASRPNFDDPMTYETLCQSSSTGTPREDGSLLSRFGEAIPAERLAVGLQGAPAARYRVADRTVATAASRCIDGIGVLLLADPLDVPELPLRFEDSDHVGEQVLLSGSTFTGGRSAHHELEGSVERVSGLDGDAELPPRSLLVSAAACSFDRGGAIFSAESGALIGLVARGVSTSCDTVGTGTTVATRLAPFRRILLEAGSAYAQPLQSEGSADGDTQLRPCGAP